MRRTRCAVVLTGAAVAMLLAGCGSKSTNSGGNGNPTPPGSVTGSATTTATGSTTAPPADFNACMVTDIGGIDDQSFNTAAWAGMQKAKADGKANVRFVESKAQTDYKRNIASLENGNCNLIVTVGGLMGDATTAAAKAKATQHYTEVDYPGNGTNFQGLQFNTAQGAFLGGYLAASYTKTGRVGTYGGLPIAPVTIYMDGFSEGVAYYNSQKGKNVQVIGWDAKTQKGSFSGTFTDPTGKGTSLAKGLEAQGVDVIFPVAGGTGKGSAAQAQASGKSVIIWVDTDGYLAAPQYKSVFLSTVFKGIDLAVTRSVEDAASGNFTAKDYIGDLTNGGTGLSPFHDFDSKVPAEVKSELTQIQQDIVSGKIKIASRAQPKAAS